MTLTLVIAYLLGSIPFALLLARWWGVYNLRTIGSGNLGAANVVRASGVRAGALVALLDISKGAASVLLAKHLTGGTAGPAAAGFMAVVGHIYPVWLGFRGGKGVATACGVFSVLTPSAIGPTLAIFAGGVWVTRYISIGSVLATTALPPIALVLGSPVPVVVSAVASAALIVFRHQSNLLRVRRGTEPHLLSSRARPVDVTAGREG